MLFILQVSILSEQINCGAVRYKNLDKNMHMDGTVRYEFEEVSVTNNFGLFEW